MRASSVRGLLALSTMLACSGQPHTDDTTMAEPATGAHTTGASPANSGPEDLTTTGTTSGTTTVAPSTADDETGASSSGGADVDEAFLFDEAVIRTYELDVADADWAWLNDNALLEQYVPATLHFEGEVHDQAAIRYKGSVGSLKLCFDGMGNQVCDKLSIKLAFDEYDDEGRFYGLKKINLHAMEPDPTRMHEAIGYKLFRDHGVAAPRTAYARVVVNDELIGLYAVVEQIDGRFTRERFPDGGEGNLYKEVWPVHLGEPPYLAALETNKDENPSADKMVRFAADLTQAGDAGFVDVVEAWMDADELMRYMAVARLIDSWDDIVAWYCVDGQPCINHNYYWYESTAEDRVWLIAWDVDHSFEEPSPIRSNYGMPDWDDIDADCAPIDVFLGIQGRAPACDAFLRGMATGLWDRYVVESEALLAGDFSLAAMNARIDELAALIADAVAEDPNGIDVAEWDAAVASLRDIVAAKRDHVAAKL
jgi:spore coat protein H